MGSCGLDGWWGEGGGVDGDIDGLGDLVGALSAAC